MPTTISSRVGGGSAVANSEERIVQEARERQRQQGIGYAKANSPKSPFRGLTGNQQPEISVLSWLKNRNKCNQFVGDVLTKAGLGMPTFRMPDGTKHFMHAEALPNQRNYFERRNHPHEIVPGDLMVIDTPGVGENTAHVEIVTEFRDAGTQGVESMRLSTIGAIVEGVVERDRSQLLRGAAWENGDGDGGFFRKGSIKTFFLRPLAVLKNSSGL